MVMGGWTDSIRNFLHVDEVVRIDPAQKVGDEKNSTNVDEKAAAAYAPEEERMVSCPFDQNLYGLRKVQCSGCVGFEVAWTTRGACPLFSSWFESGARIAEKRSGGWQRVRMITGSELKLVRNSEYASIYPCA